jgi:periplasmic protein TonB
MSHEPDLGRGLPDEGFPRRIRTALAALLAPSEIDAASVAESGGIFDPLPSTRLVDRIAEQLTFAIGELRRDPAGFAATLIAPDFADTRSRRRLQAVEAAMLAAGIVLLLLAFQAAPTWVPTSEDVPYTPLIALLQPLPPIGKGGGGSGDNATTLPSRGVRPQSSLADPIAPATTQAVPVPQNPLPIPAPVKAPPLPPDLVKPGFFGDPLGDDGPPSNGQGEGGGIGKGKGAGLGDGKGPGEGPGSDGDRGGGPRGLDRNVNTAPATAPVVLNNPRPAYTEEARREKTQGEVYVKALFGADGRIKQARVVRGLPHGLDEKAIEAVYRFDFRPARNSNGLPVDAWQTVKVRFTIR